MATTKSNGLLFKTILIGIALLVLYLGYKISIGSNVQISADTYYFFVPEKSSLETVADSLKKRGFIKSRWSFKIMAVIKGFDSIKPGMYELKNGWSNLELIEHFKTHQPKPTVFITLPSVQNRDAVINSICKGTAIHPDDVWKLLNDKKFTKELGGFNNESIFSIFIPRNYRIYKNSSAEDLLKRLYQEHLLFWNSERLEQAQDMGLKPSEVVILSSIVYSETKSEEEMPIIAGVYLNRIRIKMRLESDPTLIYASKKFDTKRVLFKDKNISSPYNTYKNKGLPPGPIYIVPSLVIDKVLEYDGHDYPYFCANHDLSGEHIFAETYEEHKENAQRYHDKLDEKYLLITPFLLYSFPSILLFPIFTKKQNSPMGIFIHTKIKLIEKGTGVPLCGETISVKLYDKDPLTDDFLGEAKPDQEGNVLIKFDLDKIKSPDTPFELFPDLYFRVYKGAIQYFQSPISDDINTDEEGDFSFTEGKIIDLGTYLI